MNKDDVLDDVLLALDRVVNDALASRDGYGNTDKDAQIVINALTAKQSVNKQLVGALKEASSALSSLNYKGTTPFIRDGGTFYGQTDEWCEWVETEILPVVRQALAAAEKEGV